MSNDYEQARDLMRKLVEAANGHEQHHGSLSETFSTNRRLFGASLKSEMTTDSWHGASYESFTDAVRDLIAQTPWAGRVL